MSRRRRRRGQRDRERRSKRVVFRAEWHHNGRVEIVATINKRGVLTLDILDSRRVGSVAREIAADWLKEVLPRLTHDQRYALLWET